MDLNETMATEQNMRSSEHIKALDFDEKQMIIDKKSAEFNSYDLLHVNEDYTESEYQKHFFPGNLLAN